MVDQMNGWVGGWEGLTSHKVRDDVFHHVGVLARVGKPIHPHPPTHPTPSYSSALNRLLLLYPLTHPPTHLPTYLPAMRLDAIFFITLECWHGWMEWVGGWVGGWVGLPTIKVDWVGGWVGGLTSHKVRDDVLHDVGVLAGVDGGLGHAGVWVGLDRNCAVGVVLLRWVGGWVGWVEENEAVGMSYCKGGLGGVDWVGGLGGWVGGWVGRWVGGLPVGCLQTWLLRRALGRPVGGGWVGGWVIHFELPASSLSIHPLRTYSSSF